jgi:hypothetical protein
MGVHAEAKNGSSLSFTHLYWSWIRHVATEEGVTLPQSGSAVDSLSDDETRKLALALKARAEKIRRGVAPRDATSYVHQIDKRLSPPSGDREEVPAIRADFDDPDSMDETADFFELSGGATLRY